MIDVKMIEVTIQCQNEKEEEKYACEGKKKFMRKTCMLRKKHSSISTWSWPEYDFSSLIAFTHCGLLKMK